MESIIDYLKRELKDAGRGSWEEIATEVNRDLDEPYRVTFHTLRKIAYGERPNLGSIKGDALRTYFQRRKKAKA